ARRGEVWGRPLPRTALRAVGVGGALRAAARVAPPGDPPFEAAAALGTAMASAGSLVALARIAPLGGMLVVPDRARRLYPAVFVAVMGAFATALPLWQAAAATRAPTDEMVEAATSFVAAASLGFTILFAFRMGRLRRFDLG